MSNEQKQVYAILAFGLWLFVSSMCVLTVAVYLLCWLIQSIGG
jgi:hypothetical protein